MPELDREQLEAHARAIGAAVETWATSPQFYLQAAGMAAGLATATLLAWLITRRVGLFRSEPTSGPLLGLRRALWGLKGLVFPILNVFLLGVAAEVCREAVGQAWLVKVAQGLAVVFLVYALVSRFIRQPLILALAKWIGIPVATLQVFGWLDDVTAYLDGISIQAGNIHVSLFALLRTLLFGAILFWLGRISNDAGKEAIRRQKTLDVGTREVFAKLFEIALFVVIFLLLLQVMGINLTALGVFGGALGVGLGFGLQQIASNFISGIIILLDRSISIGDYLELEDGRAGTLRELNMRYGILESFDGKDVLVPNETFITTSFVNWTKKNKKQRYSLEFGVAYSTDLDVLLPMIRDLVASHPQVLSGPNCPKDELPDAEISGFGDSSIDILVEFWMEGIDDGENRVGADLLYMIWKALKEHEIEIPFPQREVRILGQGSGIGSGTPVTG